jgi:hypothetical protein
MARNGLVIWEEVNVGRTKSSKILKSYTLGTGGE